MVFSSAPFIFIFLPVVFLAYSILPGLKAKNAVLTMASLLFYAYGEPLFALVMVGSVAMNYVFARLIAGRKKAPAEAAGPEAADAENGGSPDGKARTGFQKAVLFLAVVANLGMIGVFKYAAFFVETVNDLLETNYPVPEIALPIGISFFTFQALSYVIDVYRDPETVQKNFGKVLLYISFFPQLIAGPIVKYHDIAPYLSERHMDIDEIAGGIQRFVTGLAKKMFLANSMGFVADTMFGLPESDMSRATALMGAICYTLQIYFDFSGYSDMAIGIGHMFGFTIKENFDHPYASHSIKMFWRRWHISLSTWFKEYLYIPLGGSRKGLPRTELNKFIVFFCTGLWHGANWTFVLWGMIHGAAITVEDILGGIWRGITGKGKRARAADAAGAAAAGSDAPAEQAAEEPEQPKGNPIARAAKFSVLSVLHFFGWIYTIAIVILAFVFFRADTLSGGVTMIREIFTGGAGSIASYNTVMEMLSPYNIFLFALALFVCLPHPFLTKWLRECGIVSYLITIVLFGLCVLEIAGAGFNPFIYFRF